MRALRRWLTAIVHDDNLDLYVLVAVAVVFTVLGSAGVASTVLMSSITLGTLAVLAFSQIRSRGLVARMAAQREFDPLALLSRDFPADLDGRRAAAKDLLYVGVSMYRTLPPLRNDMRRMAQAGHRVRVVLVDPTDEDLVRGAALHLAGVATDDLAARVANTLGELERLSRGVSRPIELRVATVAPTMNMNVIDQDEPNGLVVLQHYEYLPGDEAAPIIRLTANDGYWYRHFVNEAERIWESSSPWPLTAAARAARHPRPRFTKHFEADLYDNIGTASDLLVTGVTRNTLLAENYSRFEQCLRGGGTIRFVLIDPASSALAVAADRYYAIREATHAQRRIAHSLGLLHRLQESTGGTVTVRLTSYPLGAGLIAIDDKLLYMEYYTYRAPGEPKFVLAPHDGEAYTVFRNEAEELWKSATPISLDGTSPRAEADRA
jgi:hypothetical protein